MSVRVYRWRNQPPLPTTPPPGPVDIATWRLLWRVYAIRPRRVEMMARRLGLVGGAPASLEQLGRDYQLSRTRVVQAHATLARAAGRVGAPVTLRTTVERLVVQPVEFEDDVVTGLLADGLLAEPLSLEALTRVAALFGLPVPVLENLGVVGGRRLVCAPELAPAVRRWRSQLVVATMILPVRLADLPAPAQVPYNLAAPLLAGDSRLECSSDGAVVWRRDRLSSAGDIVVSLLASGPQPVSALLEAIQLRYANRFAVGDFKPPSEDALRAYLAAQPWVTADGDLVTLTGPAPAPLRRVDRVFLDAFA
ncbi:MAG TPA: hypothetical protein VHJ83_05825, partial [Micromonosporaceae bacterium]|nr:hypothetical protein [Micromonosporaceae bacterium]